MSNSKERGYGNAERVLPGRRVSPRDEEVSRKEGIKTVRFDVRAGSKEALEEEAKRRGLSVAQLIVDSVNAYVGRVIISNKNNNSMGRIHWGAPFSFAQKSLQKPKKCDLPLDIYGSVCYNNSVRRAVQK